MKLKKGVARLTKLLWASKLEQQFFFIILR